tara:strand:+ start:85630 stop:85944 length:315 start_codon:yes stop_codon:yes gene_type:complete
MYGCEEDIKKEAVNRFPEEMVGYIKNGKFHALKNISTDPRKRYQLSVADKLLVLNNKVEYLVHSHPNMDHHPSQLDLQSQRSTGIPFLIIGTDGKNVTTIKEVS